MTCHQSGKQGLCESNSNSSRRRAGDQGSNLSNEGEDAKAGHLDQGDRACTHATSKLSRVARLGGLGQEGGEASDEAAAQHDRAAQNLNLAQDLVHLVQGLHDMITRNVTRVWATYGKADAAWPWQECRAHLYCI